MGFTRSDLADITNCIKQYFEDGTILKKLADSVADIVISKFEQKLDALVNRCSSMESKITQLENEKGVLSKKLEDQEQYSRRNSIRVFGLPENKDEDIEHAVLAVFNTKMQASCKPEHIDRVHRVGRRPINNDNTKSRPVIVKFISYKYRDIVFKNKRTLRGTGITIKEDLSTTRLSLLKSTADKFGYRNVWTLDGVVRVSHNGQKIAINSTADLEKLTN